MNSISKYYEMESMLNESICLDDNETSLDMLLEMLSIQMDITDYIPNSLTENISIINNFSEYMPLIEAADQIASAQKDLSELSKNGDSKQKENLLKRCVAKFKALIDWWYKIEPDKKFKTLHTVLKILVKILFIVADIYVADIVTSKVLGTKAVSKLPDKTFKIGKRNVSIKKNVIKFVTGYGLGKVSDFAKTITTEKMRFNVNKKDLDKNISELDKNIDKLNNMISEVNDPETKNALMNAKMELQDTLGKLMRLKARNEKK